MTLEIEGVFAAAVTPLDNDLQPDLEAIPGLLDMLARRGCHGALVLGTTGEGTSLSVAERTSVIREAVRFRQQARPDFRILAGTGCANLPDAIALTRAAFDLGVDAVVTLPAFYYTGIGAEGVTAYFEALVQAAVPADGRLLLYHIPQVSGVPIPPESVGELMHRLPGRVWGMKDSQDDLDHTLGMLRQNPRLHMFAGSDSIQSQVLAAGAAGTITALANVTGPINRAVWDAHCSRQPAADLQDRLIRARQAVKGLNGPAAMKAALADLLGLPLWPVRPPLRPLPNSTRERLAKDLEEILQGL
jgi:4-hydroxy-tetrahydrodipicolinate synthase